MFAEDICYQADASLSGFTNQMPHLSNGGYLAEETTILVEGLPHMTAKSDLYTYFSKFGEIKYCVMVPLDYNLKLPSLLDHELPYLNYHGANRKALFQVVEKDVATLITQSYTVMNDTRVYCSLVPQINQEVTFLFDEVMTRKIFVFGLKKSVGEEFLRRYFGVYGAIENVRIVRHRKDSRSKGFGFVIFKNAQTRDLVLQSGPFKIHNKLVRCVPFDAQLDCINGEKRASATTPNPKALSADLPTTSPKSGSLHSSKQNLPEHVTMVQSEAQPLQAPELSHEYKFNRSRIISSVAAQNHFRRTRNLSSLRDPRAPFA